MGMMRTLPLIYRGYKIMEDTTSYYVWRDETKIKEFEKEETKLEDVYNYIDKRRKEENNKLWVSTQY